MYRSKYNHPSRRVQFFARAFPPYFSFRKDLPYRQFQQHFMNWFFDNILLTKDYKHKLYVHWGRMLSHAGTSSFPALAVNFMNVKCANFLYEHCFCSFFLVTCFLWKLPKQRSCKKFVRLTLMKLTPDRKELFSWFPTHLVPSWEQARTLHD